MLFYFYDSQNTSQSVQNWCSELVKLTINKADVAEAWNIGTSISTPKHEWKMVPVGIKDHFLICNGKWILTVESHELYWR